VDHDSRGRAKISGSIGHEDLIEVFKIVLKVDSISERDSIATIASWDSLRHMKLIVAIEERFNIRFEGAEIPEITSFKAIFGAVERLLSPLGGAV
jgi:acyl carrier protein